jgi:hypothetical protein
MTTKRIMCEVVFINGEEEAKAAKDKLQASGFELMVSNHHEDIDECDDATKFGMIWKDYAEDMDSRQAKRDFETTVDAICHFCTDRTGFVNPKHVPTRYADFGETN